MNNETKEKPALLIVDMLKGDFDESRNLAITPHAKRIIRPINRLAGVFREKGWPVIFPSDAFHKDDFIFKSGMKPHSLAGTDEAEVVDDLDQEEEDLFFPKPRFSAFFKTDLDDRLRDMGVTLCAVAGIVTGFCVLTTVLDAVAHDFKAVLLEDCTASPNETMHEQTLNIYRRNPLYPILRVRTSTQLKADLAGEQR